MGYIKYSEEFKKEAVHLALSGAKSKSQTARDLGVSESKLYVWISKYGPEAKMPDTTDLKAENIRLRRTLARSEMEREILKKAIGIFSETQR